MSDDEDNNSHLRRLYRDTIVGQAYMNTLDKLVDELGGIDEEMKEKMVCIFEQVRTTFFFLMFERVTLQNHTNDSLLRKCWKK